jgi:DNA-binding PadR family transcriptional regulator
MKLIDNRRGFWWAYNDIFDFELTTNALAVYCLLCRMVGNYGHDVMPSHKYIGEKLKLSRPTIIKALNELENKLLIAVERRTEGGQKTNVYLIADGRRCKKSLQPL